MLCFGGDNKDKVAYMCVCGLMTKEGYVWRSGRIITLGKKEGYRCLILSRKKMGLKKM